MTSERSCLNKKHKQKKKSINQKTMKKKKKETKMKKQQQKGILLFFFFTCWNDISVTSLLSLSLHEARHTAVCGDTDAAADKTEADRGQGRRGCGGCAAVHSVPCSAQVCRVLGSGARKADGQAGAGRAEQRCGGPGAAATARGRRRTQRWRDGAWGGAGVLRTRGH